LTDIKITKIYCHYDNHTSTSPTGGHTVRETTDIKLHTLTMLTLKPLLRKIRHWWLRRAEEHYLICASVEHTRAREAEENEAYYQKRAAMARSAQLWD
jgi:hypothetical protein